MILSINGLLTKNRRTLLSLLQFVQCLISDVNLPYFTLWRLSLQEFVSSINKIKSINEFLCIWHIGLLSLFSRNNSKFNFHCCAHVHRKIQEIKRIFTVISMKEHWFCFHNRRRMTWKVCWWLYDDGWRSISSTKIFRYSDVQWKDFLEKRYWREDTCKRCKSLTFITVPTRYCTLV